MRIIAGVAKGRRLSAPRRGGTRPITDRAKESVFSSLGDFVAGARVLDLYAGSGSFGLEALSRGATSAVFVERGRAALEALRANVAAVGLGGEVVARDVEQFLGASGAQFDLAFVDPPYDLAVASVEKVVGLLAARLATGAVVVLHRRAGERLPDTPGSLILDDDRRQGDSRVLRFFKESE